MENRQTNKGRLTLDAGTDSLSESSTYSADLRSERVVGRVRLPFGGEGLWDDE